MFNHSQQAFEVKKGDRIAQLICEQILYPELEEAKVGHIFPIISDGVTEHKSSAVVA